MAEQESKMMNKHDENEEGESDDDRIIKKLVKEITETNRKIDDAYDEKLRRLEIKRKLMPDEQSEEIHEARISGLNEKVRELKSRISDARRSGKDPLIADLMLRSVNSKIKMAEVTREKQDFDEVEKILKRTESELEEALAEEALDVKKEINKKLKEIIAKETGKVVED